MPLRDIIPSNASVVASERWEIEFMVRFNTDRPQLLLTRTRAFSIPGDEPIPSHPQPTLPHPIPSHS